MSSLVKRKHLTNYKVLCECRGSSFYKTSLESSKINYVTSLRLR